MLITRTSRTRCCQPEINFLNALGPRQLYYARLYLLLWLVVLMCATILCLLSCRA